MSNANNSSRIYVVAAESAPVKLFFDHIAKEAKCRVVLLNFQHSKIPKASNRELYLVDLSHGKDAGLPAWLAEVSTRPQALLAVYNLHGSQQALEVLARIQLDGIFYRDESLDTIVTGVKALLNGEMWLPHKVMSKLISFYHKSQNNGFHGEWGLTTREIEMISMLKNGWSNQQIAQELFVSEHTVKSHLHNIYKKINVKNRTQALHWMHQQVGSSLPEIKREAVHN